MYKLCAALNGMAGVSMHPQIEGFNATNKLYFDYSGFPLYLLSILQQSSAAYFCQCYSWYTCCVDGCILW